MIPTAVRVSCVSSNPTHLHPLCSAARPICRGRTVVKLMEMHGDNTTEDIGMEMEREDEEGAEAVAADE